MGFQSSQQTIYVQSLGMIITVIRIIPPNDTFAQQSKPGDMLVDGIDVATHLPYFGGLGFYLLYLISLIY